MTYKEKLEKDGGVYSEHVGNIIRESCPHHFFEGTDYGCIGNCPECWGSVAPDTCELRIDRINLDISANVNNPENNNNLPTVLDSGERREFDTGAVRDMKTGKGDMASLPNAAILRLSKHYEAGALKYGRWNYTKGIPVSAFMDSALRHIFKYLDGWDDEDHLSAAAFNILGAIEMEEKHKELIDIPSREGKNTFNYKINSEV